MTEQKVPEPRGKKKDGISAKLLIGVVISGIISLSLFAAVWIRNQPQSGVWEWVTFGTGLSIIVLAFLLLIAFSLAAILEK